jgi:hypothetical protein
LLLVRRRGFGHTSGLGYAAMISSVGKAPKFGPRRANGWERQLPITKPPPRRLILHALTLPHSDNLTGKRLAQTFGDRK